MKGKIVTVSVTKVSRKLGIAVEGGATTKNQRGVVIRQITVRLQSIHVCILECMYVPYVCMYVCVCVCVCVCVYVFMYEFYVSNSLHILGLHFV